MIPAALAAMRSSITDCFPRIRSAAWALILIRWTKFTEGSDLIRWTQFTDEAEYLTIVLTQVFIFEVHIFTQDPELIPAETSSMIVASGGSV